METENNPHYLTIEIMAIDIKIIYMQFETTNPYELLVLW